MSIASIGHHCEAPISSFPEIKSPQRPEPFINDNFQSFLTTSPYTYMSPVRSPLTPKDVKLTQKEEVIAEFGGEINLLASRRKSQYLFEMGTISPEEACQINGESLATVSDQDVESNRTKTSQNSIYHNANRTLTKMPEVYNVGFEIPKNLKLSKEAIAFIEGMQTRITRLEKETVSLKVENVKLKDENKRLQDKMTVVTQEQEKVGKMKESYEKRISKLKENFETNNDIAKSLKDILNLQEEEFYERVVKKERPIQKQQSFASGSKGSNSRASTRSHIPSSSSITSIDGGLENSKEMTRSFQKPKSILKLDGKSSLSISSCSSLKLKSPRVSQHRVTIKE